MQSNIDVIGITLDTIELLTKGRSGYNDLQRYNAIKNQIRHADYALEEMKEYQRQK